jgi:hypothetical protein
MNTWGRGDSGIAPGIPEWPFLCHSHTAQKQNKIKVIIMVIGLSWEHMLAQWLRHYSTS